MKAPSAISTGVLSQLRTGPKAVTHTALNGNNSGIEQEGHPPPRAPQIYVSVTDAAEKTKGSKDGKPQNLLERSFTFSVFVSMRTGIYQPDQVELIYNRAVGSLDILESQIKAALHDQSAVRVACVANLDANEEPFLYPPYYQGRANTEVHDAGWSHEENTGDDGEVCGWLVRRMLFEGFDRIEYSSEIA